MRTLVALIFFLGTRLGAQPATSIQPPQIITVGRGQVRAAPDRATLELSVITRGDSAAAIGAENARKLRAVLDTLRSLGLTAGQIATVGYNVQPIARYEQGAETGRFAGFVARNEVRVELQNVNTVGRVIDAALARGANSVESVEFGLADPLPARRQALERAAAAARGEARAIAAALGGRVGAVIEATTARDIYGVDFSAGRITSSRTPTEANTQISPGEVEITATLQVRWRFLPSPNR